MPYKHVIWDWNGTLMDDGWLCVEIMNGLLARRGRAPVDMDYYRNHFQFPVERYYERFGFDPETDPFSRISHEFIDAYEMRRTECQLYPGVPEALAHWSDMGVEQIILSAYRQPRLEEIVAHYGLDRFFDCVIGLDNIYAESKTHNAQQHVQSIPHAPHELLLIGDTVHDFEVARAIGADCVLISHGHNAAERLRTTGSPVVESLEELIARVRVAQA